MKLKPRNTAKNRVKRLKQIFDVFSEVEPKPEIKRVLADSIQTEKPENKPEYYMMRLF